MKIRIATLIIVFASLFEAHNFGLFGGSIAGLEQGRVSLGGTTIGLAISFGAAIFSSARSDLNRGKLKNGSKNKAGRQGSQMDYGLIGVFLISGLVISPVIFIFLGDDFFVPVFRWLVSIAYAIAPSGVMFAVGAANGSKGVLRLDAELTIPLHWLTNLFTRQESVNPKPTKTKSKVGSKMTTQKKPKKKRKELTDEMLLKNIKKYPKWSQQQRADHFGYSRNTINQRMGRLGAIQK